MAYCVYWTVCTVMYSNIYRFIIFSSVTTVTTVTTWLGCCDEMFVIEVNTA